MHYSNLLHRTSFGLALGGGAPWLWPAFEALHFLGMALLVGCVGLFDLRVLGVGKALPIAPLQSLMPWGAIGFVVNGVTGVGFYAGHPDAYQTWAFAAKILFILLAGTNVLAFYASGLRRRLDSVGSGENAPLSAKLVAAGSLFLWFGVMFWGRMLPSFSQSF